MMKFFLVIVSLMFSFSNVFAYPTDSLANRMEHCTVTSVSGQWAMTNYPKSIDLYYGQLTADDQWDGFVVFGFSSNEPIYQLDKMKMYPVSIQFISTAEYAGETSTGKTQVIKFKNERYDFEKRVSIYSLHYIQDSGLYECQVAWPHGLSH